MKHEATMSDLETLRYLSKVQEEYDKKHPRKPGEWIENEERSHESWMAAVRLGMEERKAKQV